VNIFSHVRESGIRDEHATMRVAHGDAMLLVRRDLSKEVCEKKAHAF
jgi:hypothetical protein